MPVSLSRLTRNAWSHRAVRSLFRAGGPAPRHRVGDVCELVGQAVAVKPAHGGAALFRLHMEHFVKAASGAPKRSLIFVGGRLGVVYQAGVLQIGLVKQASICGLTVLEALRVVTRRRGAPALSPAGVGLLFSIYARGV